jgi:hypothetical protein
MCLLEYYWSLDGAFTANPSTVIVADKTTFVETERGAFVLPFVYTFDTPTQTATNAERREAKKRLTRQT